MSIAIKEFDYVGQLEDVLEARKFSLPDSTITTLTRDFIAICTNKSLTEQERYTRLIKTGLCREIEEVLNNTYTVETWPTEAMHGNTNVFDHYASVLMVLIEQI